jgi:hypothetical protein
MLARGGGFAGGGASLETLGGKLADAGQVLAPQYVGGGPEEAEAEDEALREERDGEERLVVAGGSPSSQPLASRLCTSSN